MAGIVRLYLKRTEPIKTWVFITFWPMFVWGLLLFGVWTFKTLTRAQCIVWWPAYALCVAGCVIGGLASAIGAYHGIYHATHSKFITANLSIALLRGALWFGVPMVLLWGPAGLVLAREWVGEFLTLQRWFRFGHGGSSRWAGPRSLGKHRWRHTDGPNGPLSDHIYLGRSLFEDECTPRDISIKDDAHLLTIGQPGSGKSTTVIWPNLATYKGSAVVIDPKGEHARMAAVGRARNRMKGTFILDPFGETAK